VESDATSAFGTFVDVVVAYNPYIDLACHLVLGFGMIIMALTDVPRLVVAVFLGGAAPLVQTLGWATWLGAAVLFTMMVSRSHELAWPRALAASAIQLLAVLMLVKLGTL
jgi:hypothetical protein